MYDFNPVRILVGIIGLLASFITIYVYFSGENHFSDLLNRNSIDQSIIEDSIEKSGKSRTSNPSPKVGYTASADLTTEFYREVKLEKGFFGSSVFLIEGPKKTEIYSGMSVHSALVSPDQKKILIVAHGVVILMDIDGKNARSYYLNSFGMDIYREIWNIIFVGPRAFRAFINLSNNDNDIYLGDIPLKGMGEYEIKFDEYNSLTKVYKLRK